MTESKIYGNIGPQAFPILDISISGMTFFSEVNLEPGAKLVMSALGMIALEVEVIRSVMEETDSGLMEYKYRVDAKFGSHVNGYQVYVLATEMKRQDLKGKPSVAGFVKPFDA